MSRPDPFEVQRKPMARAGRDVAFARRRQDGAQRPVFTADGALDVDGLQRALEAAESVIEGRPEPDGRRFFGSAVLTVEVPADAAGTLAVAMTTDARARRAVRDRVFRELARLLGPSTPADFELGLLARVKDGAVRVEVDIEAALPVVAQTS